jgi:hypothetical protein
MHNISQQVLLIAIISLTSMSIFSPASPETQAAPILKAQEQHLNNQIPSVLNADKPKDSPSGLFQSYLTTGNPIFKTAAGTALNALHSFADKAGDIVDSIAGNNVKVDNTQPQPIYQAQHVRGVNFSENAIPTANLSDGTIKPIDQVNLDVQPHPLTSISYSIPRGTKDGVAQTEKQTITDPSALKVAGTIKAVADQVNPDYTNYLLKLANNEGVLKADQRNYNFKDGKSSTNPADAAHHGGVDSVDRGVFQINSKAFPHISDAVADDPARAALWAIGLIDAGKQSKWMANDRSKETKISYQ